MKTRKSLKSKTSITSKQQQESKQDYCWDNLFLRVRNTKQLYYQLPVPDNNDKTLLFKPTFLAVSPAFSMLKNPTTKFQMN